MSMDQSDTRCHCTACKMNTAIKEDCVESGKREGGRGRREGGRGRREVEGGGREVEGGGR